MTFPCIRRVVLGFTLLLAPCALSQANAGWGRLSLFGQAIKARSADGTTSSFSEIAASLALRSPSADEGGLEYAVDARGATYPSSEREQRLSLYDAYVGGRTSGGRFGLRLGQMYLSELGALGSIGGLLAEVRSGPFRVGLFGGLEPRSFQAGYVSNVKKGGAYLALDGEKARRHVLGYVTIRNSGLTERSVVTLSNFVPIGKQFFMYQAAEYDLAGPGGQGRGGLNYFFANARYAPFSRLEIQATFQHGRSIDARTITQDQLNGLPVDPKSLEGFLFESAGGRLTVRVLENVRVYAGYSRDRNNQADPVSNRITLGLNVTSLAGFDVTVADNRIERASGGFDSWYVSLGRNLTSRVYLSADYSTSLSVLRVTGDSGLVVENRPRTRRFGLSGVANLTGAFSVLLTAERVTDDFSTDDRGMLGLMVRF